MGLYSRQNCLERRKKNDNWEKDNRHNGGMSERPERADIVQCVQVLQWVGDW